MKALHTLKSRESDIFSKIPPRIVKAICGILSLVPTMYFRINPLNENTFWYSGDPANGYWTSVESYAFANTVDALDPLQIDWKKIITFGDFA